MYVCIYIYIYIVCLYQYQYIYILFAYFYWLSVYFTAIVQHQQLGGFAPRTPPSRRWADAARADLPGSAGAAPGAPDLGLQFCRKGRIAGVGDGNGWYRG